LAILNKLGSGKVQIASEQPANKFSVDMDVLSTDPHVVARKLNIATINKLNTVDSYKSYGVVKLVVETKTPQTNLNKILAANTSATDNIFVEYIVQQLDSAHASILSGLNTVEDIFKSTSLLRCSSKLPNKISPGTIVEIDFYNSEKEEACISAVYGELAPIVQDDKQNSAVMAFEPDPCNDQLVSPSSDFINDSSLLTQKEAPTPKFLKPECLVKEEPIKKYIPEENGKISKYYTLENLTKSNTAKRLGILNDPDDVQKERLIYLANIVLDKIADIYTADSVYITNCFRSDPLNKAIRGAQNSQHKLGTAADIKIMGLTDENLFDAFENISKSNIQFDQLIFESNGKSSFWFHISIAHPSTDGFTENRGQVISFGPWSSKNGKKTYLEYDRKNIQLYLSNNDISLTETA